MKSSVSGIWLFASIILLSLSASSRIAVAAVSSADFWQGKSTEVWEKNLRQQYFAGKELLEGVAAEGIISIKAPHAAEDASLVPISIHSGILQTKELYIRKITLLVDKNPVPLVGEFVLSLDSGKADLAMRIRVDDFTYVRAIAETSDGRFYMAKTFVNAKGACSAPPPPGMEDSKRLLGKMKLKSIGSIAYGKPSLMKLVIRHPNITGMAPLRVGSRVRPPPFFVKQMEIDYNGKTILKANLTFSISMDPSFRFFFIPDKPGTLIVRGVDTKNNAFEGSQDIQATGSG